MSGPFPIAILLRERGRYIPAEFAVSFSSLLLTMQLGMLLGFLATTTRPIDRVDADARIGRSWCAAEIEQEFVRRLKVGQRVRVEDESTGGTVRTGRVARIAGWYSPCRGANDKPSAFKDVPTVECLIHLDDRRPPLRIGQRFPVTIGN